MTKKTTASPSRYQVVLQYTKVAGGYAGVRTRTSFASKAEFDTWWLGNVNQKIVEEDVTDERAIALCQQTPLESLVGAAISDATNPETGRVNLAIAEMKLQTGLLARYMRF